MLNFDLSVSSAAVPHVGNPLLWGLRRSTVLNGASRTGRSRAVVSMAMVAFNNVLLSFQDLSELRWARALAPRMLHARRKTPQKANVQRSGGNFSRKTRKHVIKGNNYRLMGLDSLENDLSYFLHLLCEIIQSHFQLYTWGSFRKCTITLTRTRTPSWETRTRYGNTKQ